ncbi:MAG: hypothetical protein EBS39_04490 [Gammaproteobacteria bacterium]|nr:hypothetical protein [Gammaproteobacteria bacterium]
MPLLAITGWPSTEASCHPKSGFSLRRFATRSGSIAAANASIGNCGARTKAMRMGVPASPRRASRVMAVFGGFSPIAADIVCPNPRRPDVEVSHGDVGWI